MHFDSTISLGSILAALTIVIAIIGSSFRIASKMFALFEQVDRRLMLVEKALVVIEPRTQMLYEAELRRGAVDDAIRSGRVTTTPSDVHVQVDRKD